MQFLTRIPQNTRMFKTFLQLEGSVITCLVYWCFKPGTLCNTSNIYLKMTGNFPLVIVLTESRYNKSATLMISEWLLLLTSIPEKECYSSVSFEWEIEGCCWTNYLGFTLIPKAWYYWIVITNCPRTYTAKRSADGKLFLQLFQFRCCCLRPWDVNDFAEVKVKAKGCIVQLGIINAFND